MPNTHQWVQLERTETTGLFIPRRHITFRSWGNCRWDIDERGMIRILQALPDARSRKRFVNALWDAQIRHLTRDGCLWLAGKRRNRNLMAGENRLEGRITDFAVSRLPCKLIFRTQLPNPRAILPLDFGCDFAVGYSFGLSRKWGAGR